VCLLSAKADICFIKDPDFNPGTRLRNISEILIKGFPKMAETHSLFDSLQSFTFGAGRTGQFYSLPQLEKAEVGPISKLPVSLRIVLESVLRNYDKKRVREADVCALANWQPNAERRSRLSSPALSCRTSPAFRCWWTWPRCAPRCPGWAVTLA
jgi:hypothetical protein